MIRWCAYCQQFLAEEEPFDRYQISYGVCAACKPKIQTFSETDHKNLEGILAFYIRLEESALAGTNLEVSALLAEGRDLGIRPLDLLMGMAQPLLAKIGDLWAANQVSVHTEHRFTALVANLAAQVRLTARLEMLLAAPDLLLLPVDENQHTLGVQLAEVYFAIHGIPTLAVTPGLPTREILELVALHRPRALGFSVALPTQLNQVLEVAMQLKGRPEAPRHLLLGGPAVRRGLELDPAYGIAVCRDLAEARERLAEPLQPEAH